MIAIGKWAVTPRGRKATTHVYEVPIYEFDAELDPIFVVTATPQLFESKIQAFVGIAEMQQVFLKNGYKEAEYLGFYAKQWETSPLTIPEQEEDEGDE